MKNIKVVFLLAILLVGMSCSDQNNSEDDIATAQKNLSKISEDKYDGWVNVGIIEDGSIRLTANRENLINSVNTNLAEPHGKGPKVNTVAIKQINNFYYLEFRGLKDVVTFYIQKGLDGKTLKAAAKTSCATLDPDCSQEQLGCIPEYPNNPAGNSGIGKCTPCSNGGACTKTVSGDPIIQG